MKEPELFVFDLDGTLIDSRTDLAMAVNAALKILGLPQLSKATITGYVGDGIDTLIRRSLTERYLDRFEQAKKYFASHYQKHCLDHTKLLPEVAETLKKLHLESRLAVLTNKSEPYAIKILEGLGVAHYFDAIIGERNGSVPKPGPETLVGLIRRLRVSKDRTMMVGDGGNDILTARRAGCLSCGIADSIEKQRKLRQFNPDFLIRRMDELPKLFDERSGGISHEG